MNHDESNLWHIIFIPMDFKPLKKSLIFYFMKKILTFIAWVAVATSGFAQQDPQFTQFMYNKLTYNAGYAGSNPTTCVTAIYRQQWLGLEGAPATQVLSCNLPLLNQRVGVGLQVTRNTIGVENKLTFEGSYAYRIPLGRGMLGLGLQASIRRRAVDYSDPRIVTTQGGDPNVPTNIVQSKYLPNFGAGAYYNTDRFYIGFSAPRLLQNNIDFASIGTIFSKEVPHLYLMTGYRIPFNEDFAIQPQALLKFVNNSPLGSELNLDFIFLQKYTIGGTYRLGGTAASIGNSVNLLFSAQVTGNIFFGLSYDITLSPIKTYNSGSIEAMVRYCFGDAAGSDYVNPRFF